MPEARWKYGTWVVGGVAGTAAALGLAATLSAQPKPALPAGVVPEHVSLMGVPVSGKSAEEVDALARDMASRLLALPLSVKHPARTQRATAASLGGTVDTKSAVEAVFRDAGTEPGFLDRIRERFTAPEKTDVPLEFHVTSEGVTKGLRRYAAAVGTPPRDARLTKIDGKFKRTPAKVGRTLDTAALAKAVQKALDAAEVRALIAASVAETPDRAAWLTEQKPLTVTATTREAAPHVTDADLKAITATLSKFSTHIAGSKNRVSNIRLASAGVDGVVLLPGDTFSFNDVVGPRTSRAGYKEAPVIIRGELDQGIGGGICQVSSTLYNAALLADMQIVRRSHHAFPVHYVPAGRDATVAWGSLDFRFKNRLDHPVAIDAKVVGARMVLNFYGHPEDKRDVEVATSGLSRTRASSSTVSDSRLPKGRRVVERASRGGIRVTVNRVVKRDGELLRREVVARDYYRPLAGVTRVGTREPIRRAPQPTTAKEETEETPKETSPSRGVGTGASGARTISTQARKPRSGE
jgi:vancomycin resistance protein YoaR